MDIESDKNNKFSGAVKNFFLKTGNKFKSFKGCLEYLNSVSVPENNTALGRINAFPGKRLYFSLSLLVMFLIIYGMLFYCFPPNIIFSGTTTNGGDMGAHNYIAKFFIEELFPHMRMTGWDMGWFAGMPMLTFYFPLPYFLMALLSKFVGYNISFKLVTILGSLILPVSIYYFGRLFRFKYPYPEFAAIGSMAFLYMKSFTIYGGNFLGTFAGEFSYSISFGLIFIFLATLYRGIERQKFDWLFTINCLLLACIVLTHLITLIALIIIVPSYYFINRKWSCAKYIIAVFAVGFFLSAFWSLPFVLLINWTPEMNWTNLKEIKKLFPLELIPALLLAAAGLFFSTIKKDRKMVPVTWTVIIFMSLFFTWNSGRLYNARFLPFIFIFIYLIAAYGLSSLYWMFATIYPLKKKDVQNSVLCDSAKDVNHDAPIPDKKLKISFPGFQNKFYKFIIFVSIPLVAFLGAGAILAGSPLGPAWARHNYTGFEDKADWKLYDSLMKYLDSLPYGRVMFEFNKSIIQKFGTPRSLELIPFWTHQAGMEGLLVESSLTAPFHYINQAELSVKPRGTVAGWKVPSRNYEDAMTHLKYMNISYIMASSPEVQEDLDRDSSVVFLNKIDPYYFYEIKGPHNYVEILENMPFRYKPQDNWVWEMRDWYLNAGNIDNPVIFDDGSAGMNRFLQINKESLSNVPENPVKDNKGKVLLESVEREKIEFETTAIGQPHLIKVSYFPNWKVSGAEGPYLVSPSFMLVFPTQNRVTLYYGMTYANIIGVTLSISGWIIIAAILIFNLIVFIRLKKNP